MFGCVSVCVCVEAEGGGEEGGFREGDREGKREGTGALFEVSLVSHPALYTIQTRYSVS